jgi:hypothetical protein
MLRRILFVVLILFLLWRVVTAWGRRLRRDQPSADSFSRYSAKARERRHRREPEPEELVVCDNCGTYVPLRKALTSNNERHFCSEACRRADRDAAGAR